MPKFNTLALTSDNRKALLTAAQRAQVRTIQAYPERNAPRAINAAYLRAVELSGSVVDALKRSTTR